MGLKERRNERTKVGGRGEMKGNEGGKKEGSKEGGKEGRNVKQREELQYFCCMFNL